MENVHFLEYKKYEELPNYMRALDIGLLPTLINIYTDSMFPMKLFEYISSGLPVISTPLKFLKSKLSNFVIIAKTREEFLSSINETLQNKKLNIEEARLIIADNTWATRLNKMLFLIVTSTK
jgi:glycosyltransferase involved in cell wall biosynthesis